MTPEQIQRAKQKAAKIKEDAIDQPIVDMLLAVEEIKEERIKKFDEAMKSLNEVVKIEESIVDEKGFLEAKEFAGVKGGKNIFGKILKGLIANLCNLPKSVVSADLFEKLTIYLCLFFQVNILIAIFTGAVQNFFGPFLAWIVLTPLSVILSAWVSAPVSCIWKYLEKHYK